MIGWMPVCLLALGFLAILVPVQSCNEAICASVVSKCMLTQSCKCDLKNCSCCKECFNCLGYLYSECCSCVEMCPKPNATGSALSKKSHVEDLIEHIPDLFQALTVKPDSEQRWTTFTFPVDHDVTLFNTRPDKGMKYAVQGFEQEVDPSKRNIMTLNCTVAYMSQCMSWNKCRAGCQSMGATSYRWFHDGCCECIGLHCIKYGINDSRCLNCPNEENEDYALDDSELDYAEDMNLEDI